MKIFSASALVSLSLLSSAVSAEHVRRREQSDDYCVEVTLTGTMGGPWVFNGLAGPGTLVTYGTVESGCRSDAKMQFDVGRGTSLQLSKIGLRPTDINAVFFTHVHSDHTDDFSDFMQYKFQFTQQVVEANFANNDAPFKIDVVCTSDTVNPVNGVTSSCEGLIDNVGAAFIASGEIAQRQFETPGGRFRAPDGPSQLIRKNLFSGSPSDPVWERGDVQVFASSTAHIGGHASYKIVTPAGSVVIGGDAFAGSSTAGTSTSAVVEQFAQDVDILVHSAIHPAFGPNGGSNFPPPFYARQANTVDIGALAQNANVGKVMLTHLIPSMGAETFIAFTAPTLPLGKGDFKSSVKEGGFKGPIFVGEDLMSVRVPDDR